MKITFQTTELPEQNRQWTPKTSETRQSVSAAAYGAYFQSGEDRNNLVAGANGREKGKTLSELQQEAGNIDVGIMQDYKTVLSNTMSSEDYARLEKDGFDFGSMDPKEAVTIVDKIKAELVRSGKQIAGYTDDLDMDTLAAAVGSMALAQALSDSFIRADIPVTEENLSEVSLAWEMAADLRQPTEAGYLYMVEQGMNPEIQSFYLAQNSGAAEGSGQARYYAEDIGGYLVESAAIETSKDMGAEIERALLREGVETNDQNREVARQLLEGNIPLNAENIKRLNHLQEVTFPVTEEVFADAAAAALTEGRHAVDADLTQARSAYEKAADYLSGEWLNRRLEQDPGARRQLEEVRLMMTAEVNVKLIKSGFSIDTAPMEQLIEALKQAEREVAETYFPQDTDAIDKYRLLGETNRVIQDVPTLPAQLLGSIPHVGESSLREFHAQGSALREEYQRANERYEELMTAPRKDLGDSIRKAFANVDDILEDMQLDITEENRRAVRILGYNRMEMTQDNLQRVSEAALQVENVIKSMTPAAVLKMIRDGKNPLDSSFAELEQYFGDQPEGYREQAEDYSRFLYGLEKNHDITENERESYIGIYRMLRQIEKTDGAAIGALVNSSAELHFSNLLAAVRSGRFKSLDAKVSDSFGATVEVLRRGESISDQIAKGFAAATDQMLEELSGGTDVDEAYRRMELEQLREAVGVDKEIAALLERAQIPTNADSLLAAEQLLSSESNLFLDLRAQKEKYDSEKVSENTAQDWDGLFDAMENKEEFQESYLRITEELTDEVEEVSLRGATASVDVTALQMMHKQLSVMGSLSRAEEYIIPMYVEGELTKIHLTFEQGGEEKGRVRISADLSGEDRVEAQLTADNGKIGGMLLGNTESAVTKLEQVADIFYDSLQAAESLPEAVKLPVVHVGAKTRPSAAFQGTNADALEDVDNGELYRIAKIFLQAVKRLEKR